MMNKELISREYDYLDDWIYVDTSLVSMPPNRVRRAWQEYIEGYARCYDQNYSTYFPEKLESARTNLARLLAVDESEIAFTHSTADSMTILANSFPFRPGDNVIITAEEHASNAIPWLGLERLGVEVRIAPSKGGYIDVADIAALMDRRTRIVSTASVYFCSGFSVDLDALAEECRRRNVVLAIDATQSLGRIKLHPREKGVDYIAGGGHKGLLGTKSVGYAYCSQRLLDQLQPYTGSLQSAANGGRPFRLHHLHEIEWSEGARRLESGNYSFGVIEALGNGVSLINELGIEEIEANVRASEQALREALADVPLRMLEPLQKLRSGMLFIFYPQQADPERVKEVLLSHHVKATVRYDYVRMTMHLYNSPDQAGRIADTFREIAALG